MEELKKKMIVVEAIDYGVYEFDGMTITEVNKQIKDETKRIAKVFKIAQNKLTVTFYGDQYYEDVSFGLRFSRMETDKEFKTREAATYAARVKAAEKAKARQEKKLQAAAKKLAATEDKEKELLEFLKSKYESA